MCIGHKDVLLKQEYMDRQLQYVIVQGWADPKSLPKINVWWPIEGEPIKKIRVPSKARLLKLDNIFRNFGKKKDGG